MSKFEASPATEVGFSAEPAFAADAALISRIVSAYKHALSRFDGTGDSQWTEIAGRSTALHSNLLDGYTDKVRALLRYPATHDLLYGFDETNRTRHAVHSARNSTQQEAYGHSIHNSLVRLAEAVGALSVRNPEAPWLNVRDIGVEALFRALDDKLGFEVDFPNPYPGEFGLKTTRGIIDHRATSAIYQAWRLFNLTGKRDVARVLEIGAGVGRTAYYSRKLGLLDYTIVDLPLINVAQANFLGRVLDESFLVLSNEEDGTERRDKIRIFGPQWLLNSSERFDVVLNVDSITEIDCRQAVSYFKKVVQCSEVFVSINHEVNSFRACDLPILGAFPIMPLRYPYWLRDGYVEELFFFKQHIQSQVDARPTIDHYAKVVLDQQVQLSRQSNVLRSRRALVRQLMKMTLAIGRARRGWS